MNLNVTVEDLRLGLYESQKRFLFRTLVQKRAILNHPGDNIIPPQFVPCELLKLMIENSVSESGIIVVHAERGLGKTTAAKFILKNSAGGVMFCNRRGTTTDGLYWKGVAQSIGIPSDVYKKDNEWETLLVKAVAAAERPVADEEPRHSSWISQVLERFRTLCDGRQLDHDDDFDPPSIERYALPPINKRAVIVFDDFNDVENEDIEFMRHLFPIVEGYGVLAFVLVRDEHTANRLLRLNGWGRIAPLEGICKDISKGSGEKIPQWEPPRWTRSQLVTLVRSRISNVDLERLEIADADNPFDVLKRARKTLVHT